MALFEIEVEHTVTYRHTLTVECEAAAEIELVNDDLGDAINMDDVICKLENNNVKIKDYCEDDSGECELDIIDIIEL